MDLGLSPHLLYNIDDDNDPNDTEGRAQESGTQVLSFGLLFVKLPSPVELPPRHGKQPTPKSGD